MSLNIYRTDQELEEEFQEAVTSGRKNEKNVRTVLFIGLFIVLGGVPLIIGYFAYQVYSAHSRLNNGTKTTATLDNKYTEIRSNRTGTKYEVSYSFTVNERKYSGDSYITEKPTSSKAAVIYDPTDPNNNKLEGGKDFYERTGETIILALILGIVTNAVTWGLKLAGKFSFPNSLKKRTPTFSSQPSTYTKKTVPKSSQNFQISSDKILWIEKEILKLNKEMWGEERPPHNSQFLQTFPEILLRKDDLSTNDIAEAAKILVNETRKRINRLEVPFRKPRVEFTKLLPNNEPGHIEFGEYETIIRIHPDYKDNPFGLASILCHELAHFILDHNGLRKNNTNENEKLTDLFIFVCGQGLIHLQGIIEVTSKNGQTIENKLGYLSIEEMAYAHARCSAQHKISTSKIAPEYFSGKVFEELKKAINFLKIRSGKSETLAEIILCPKNHILRISTDRKSQTIRCPKCKWKKEIWFRRSDQIDSLLNNGIKDYDSGNFTVALETFRKIQSVDKSHSMAYCFAARCLKKLGKKQDAIRELQKLLSFRPEDQVVQDEMKTLIYN